MHQPSRLLTKKLAKFPLSQLQQVNRPPHQPPPPPELQRKYKHQPPRLSLQSQPRPQFQGNPQRLQPPLQRLPQLPHNLQLCKLQLLCKLQHQL